MERFYSVLPEYIPALVSAAIVVVGLYVANWLLFGRRRDLTEDNLFHGRIVMLLLVGLVGITDPGPALDLALDEGAHPWTTVQLSLSWKL